MGDERNLRDDLYDEITVLRELIDAVLDQGLGPLEGPLLRAYAETLRKRAEFFDELQQVGRAA